MCATCVWGDDGIRCCCCHRRCRAIKWHINITQLRAYKQYMCIIQNRRYTIGGPRFPIVRTNNRWRRITEPIDGDICEWKPSTEMSFVEQIEMFGKRDYCWRMPHVYVCIWAVCAEHALNRATQFLFLSTSDPINFHTNESGNFQVSKFTHI